MPPVRTRNTAAAEAVRWLMLAAGLVSIAACVLASAHHDLALARHQRDLALLEERDRLARLDRHGAFLDAVERRDPMVMSTLVRTQFDARSGLARGLPGSLERDATFWAHLEPVPAARPTAPRPDTLLARLAVHDRMRLRVIAVAAVLVLIGLLPTGAPRP